MPTQNIVTGVDNDIGGRGSVFNSLFPGDCLVTACQQLCPNFLSLEKACHGLFFNQLIWQKQSTLGSIVPFLMFDFSMIQKDGMNPTDMSQKQADRSVDPSGSFAKALGTYRFQCQFQNNIIQVEKFLKFKK